MSHFDLLFSTVTVEPSEIFDLCYALDYPELMEINKDNRKWRKWNLEYSADLLSRRFPDSYVWIIRPVRKYADSFSCFDNFVDGDVLGTPSHSDKRLSIHHLKELLNNSIHYVNSENLCKKRSKSVKPDLTCQTAETLDCNEVSCDSSIPTVLPVVIVGFSKGCIVLNQMLHELGHVHKDKHVNEFVGRWKALYWLDGGHSGEHDTWITDETILKELTKLNLQINVHVTPFQIKDPRRPWKGKAERLFVDTLKELGADVREVIHFEDAGYSFANHFKVLEAF
ncbi:mitochondrial protein C2orf69 homolog [Saccoglossus kowalevskii]|uniref:UPF0565 protein C2orf69 homolog n=1 Tax=Saccoglossus kowalevskii TaxID=10224 RepID=A0ABM0GVU7_SACKO|nr:PREDICTED: UPF0565 protein C2orf69 homolog [Saccoglossus kowalevskii]